MQVNQSELTAVRQTADRGTPLPAIVDQLTAVQVQIAVLEALERNLKADLIASGLHEVLAQSFKPTPEEVLLFSSKKDPVTSVRLYGYN